MLKGMCTGRWGAVPRRADAPARYSMMMIASVPRVAAPGGGCLRRPESACSCMAAAMRRRSVAARAGEQAPSTTTVDAPTAAETVTYSLLASPLRTSLLLDLLPEGRGQAVVVVGVLEGSEADKAGIVPGQKLLAICDPLRPDEMWSLQDRPSLRFVKDLMQAMRDKEVRIEMSARPLFTAADATSSASESMSSTDGDDTQGEMPAAVPAAPKSDVQRRIERRKAYMDEVYQRDDRAFLSIAAFLFLGPALAILAWAYFSGYLDTMYVNSLKTQY